MVLPDPHEVGMEDLQKDRALDSGGGTGIRAGGHKTVGPGNLHHEGGGTDPF